MLESITVTETTPFVGEQPMLKARRLNYVFGANGVGKTTISRILANPGTYPGCKLTWQGGQPLETLVLNRDFVDANFGQFKGIFTLGEKQKNVQEDIRTASDAVEAERSKREGLRQTLQGEDGDGGKNAELANLKEKFKDVCWQQKKAYDKVFKDAFVGTMTRDKFKTKVLDERARNTADLKPYEELAERAETLFGERPTEENSVPTVNLSALLTHETAPILKKPVIGKTGVDIADMVEKLGNSDWVRQGRVFYDANDGNCPFCQQETPQSFANSLEAYFDETYTKDKQAIDNLVSSYFADAQTVQQRIDDILSEPGKFVDVEKLQTQKALLDETVRANSLELQRKQDAPSRVVELQSLADIAVAIKDVIEAANARIREHNQTVRNFDAEQRRLKTQVWRYVLDELQAELKWYEDTKANLDKAIDNIGKQIEDADDQITSKRAEIRSLEKQTTSVRPTVEYINDILKKFGFKSFSLAIGDDGRSYKLVRPTGEDAGKTLSEGEKSFVVFLYFYHWLRGSTSESGMTVDRAVVFDDPVSSLDSDILFIVSTLIREVCEEARENGGHIKQVFVFTHNVYFHREVTYRQHGPNSKQNNESFWVVRKRIAGSTIEVHENNPIKTSYELLWSEVRKPDSQIPGLENTLRRILEYYFKVIGGTPLDKLYENFEGQDKLICKSLLSWANAGSHNILDPLFVTPGDVSMESHLRVFRLIFEQTGQYGHYRMMMGDDFVEEPTAANVTAQVEEHQ